MCLTLGVSILASTTEIQILLSSQCTVHESVWSAKATMQCQISVVFLIALYMYLIYPSVESEATAGCICNYHNTAITRRVLIMPETYYLLLVIME